MLILRLFLLRMVLMAGFPVLVFPVLVTRPLRLAQDSLIVTRPFRLPVRAPGRVFIPP